MKSVFWGLGVSLDEGKSNPAVAVNSAGGATLVHLDGGTAYYRFGTFEKATMNWRSALPVPLRRPVRSVDVANNTTGAILAAREDPTGFVIAVPGRYTEAGISWGSTPWAIDTLGERPSVAMNEGGLCVVVYESNDGDALMYATGTSDGASITGGGWKVLQPTGTRPAVALNNHGQLALAYQDGDDIWLMIGTVSQGAILPGWSGKVAKGSEPSVALTDDDLVFIAYEGYRDDDSLFSIAPPLRQLSMQLVNGVPSKISDRHYDSGGSPSVAASGALALEVHLLGGVLQYASSLVTDRASWMADRLGAIGGKPLKKLVLPASHDAGMYSVTWTVAKPWAQTQVENVRRQLDDGIRWFDLRVERVDNHIAIHHNEWEGPRLAEVIAQIKGFIESGRRELILLKFRSFEDFHADTWLRFAKQMKALEPWMYKKADLAGRRLADITLDEYLSGGSRIIVLMQKLNDALPDGYWLYRGNGKDAAEGALRVFDHYSETEDLDEMKANQLQKFADYTGKCKDGSACELFLFSYTLTPILSFTHTVPTPIIALVLRADPYLAQTVSGATVPNAHGQMMNLLYVDYVQYARVCDVALYELDVPTP